MTKPTITRRALLKASGSAAAIAGLGAGIGTAKADEKTEPSTKSSYFGQVRL